MCGALAFAGFAFGSFFLATPNQSSPPLSFLETILVSPVVSTVRAVGGAGTPLGDLGTVDGASLPPKSRSSYDYYGRRGKPIRSRTSKFDLQKRLEKHLRASQRRCMQSSHVHLAPFGSSIFRFVARISYDNRMIVLFGFDRSTLGMHPVV